MFNQYVKVIVFACGAIAMASLSGCSFWQSSGGASPDHVDMSSEQAVSRHSNDMMWIRSQNPHHYTLQIYTTSSPQGVNAFNSQFEGSTTVYRYYTGGGQVAYGIIYGQFTTPDAAKAAIPRLPVSRMHVSASVRSFGQLQNLMLD